MASVLKKLQKATFTFLLLQETNTNRLVVTWPIRITAAVVVVVVVVVLKLCSPCSNQHQCSSAQGPAGLTNLSQQQHCAKARNHHYISDRRRSKRPAQWAPSNNSQRQESQYRQHVHLYPGTWKGSEFWFPEAAVTTEHWLCAEDIRGVRHGAAAAGFLPTGGVSVAC